MTATYDPSLNKIQGWMENDELLHLFQLAQQMRSVVEVGCWRGRSTHALLSGCPGVVYAVDHFLGSVEEREDNHKDAYTHDIERELRENLASFPNLRVVRMESVEASRILPDVDMVFIDASHNQNDVRADVRAWLPKARILLCGHDANMYQVEGGLRDVVGGNWGRGWQLMDGEIRCTSNIWEVWKNPMVVDMGGGESGGSREMGGAA